MEWAGVEFGWRGMIGAAFTVGYLCPFDADGPGPGLPVLVAAGWFTSAGGVPVNRIATWNGSTWSALGTGIPADLFGVNGVTSFDADGEGPGLPTLVIIGESQTWPGGREVYQWDGNVWTALPDPGENVVHCITSFDEDGPGPGHPTLVIGLRHNPGIMKLDDGQWQVLGGGLSMRSGLYRCDSMCVVDEDGPGPGHPNLWVGGFFSHAGPVYSPGLARWTGEEWLVGPLGFGGFVDSVHDLAVVDFTDGLGSPDVFMTTLGRLQRWNPRTNSWWLLGTTDFYEPMMRTVIAAYRVGSEPEPSVFIAGAWTDFNEVPSDKLARLRCEACYPNCDGSTRTPRLTANEFICFMGKFASGDPYANCDGSTGSPQLTANDFQCFINAYATGCP